MLYLVECHRKFGKKVGTWSFSHLHLAEDFARKLAYARDDIDVFLFRRKVL